MNLKWRSHRERQRQPDIFVERFFLGLRWDVPGWRLGFARQREGLCKKVLDRSAVADALWSKDPTTGNGVGELLRNLSSKLTEGANALQ